MKTILAMTTLALTFTTVLASAKPVKIDRPRETAMAFLKEANKKGSAISNELQKKREELANGHCDEECVMPAKLKMENVRLVTTSNELYTGKLYDENTRDPGYENWTFAVFVPANEVVYGGRIRSTETVKFTCTLEAKDIDAVKTTIACSVAE